MRCDGMDVVETYHVMREAIRRAREDRQPILVEAVTYRFRGHSMADPEEYRTKEQVAEWRKRDPINAFAERLCATACSSEGEPSSWTRRRSAASTRRSKFADKAAFPPPESLYDHIYVLGDQVRGLVLGRRAVGRRAPRRARAVAGRGRARPRTTRTTRRSRRPTAKSRRDAEKPADEAESCRSRTRRTSLVAVVRYREALNQALREEMQRDERVFLMGEDIGVFNGAFKVTAGLLEEFGEKRVRDTPISENTIVGMGVGAAMTGLRPVVELMTINFSLLAMDQIVNHMATIHYMFGGQAKVPMVVRMPQGAGHQLGPTHSHCLEAHVPARAGHAARRPLHRGRRQGPAEGGDPRRQPGRLHRARVPVRPARRRARGRRPRHAVRAGRDPARGVAT